MAVDYKKIGLVNTKDMFARAIKGGWAVPAFNFNNLEQLQAIIQASSNLKSPVILQVSKGAVEYAKELGCNHPEIVLHLDHGDSFETCKDCVDFGFSSVMIDGSALPYEENIALTKKVVDYAHQFGVTVEGELGVLAGVEDDVVAEESHYTKPEEVVDFATRTGVDSLAISIGTSHGATSSSQSSAHVTLRLVTSFLLHWHSTYWQQLRSSFLVSLSFSTVLLQFLRSMLKSSTSSVVSCQTQLVSQRSS